jgi:sulfatase modifying factor 1
VNAGSSEATRRFRFLQAVSPGCALLGVIVLGGCVKQRCYDNRDCPARQSCLAGACVLNECDADHPCPPGFECVLNRCQSLPPVPITCPADMVSVAERFCVDTYEASRPDATETSAGSDGSRALSVDKVIPWQVADNQTAESACAASGKRLCTPDEWRTACRGPAGTVYAYGDSYDATICNGIDTFGRQSFHLMPTGSFSECTNEWGVFDMNGNLWEHVAGGSDATVRGGAFNCNDSAALHKCDYIPGNWTPSARGFRCCLTPTTGSGDLDGGAVDATMSDDGAEGGAGCVDDGDGGARDGSAYEVEPDRSNADQGGGDDGAEGWDAEADVPVSLDGASQDAENPLGTDSAGETAGGEAPPCPPDMVLVGSVCVDRYEASRHDATATNAGTDESVALSQPGVLPWYVNPMSEEAFEKFRGACEASGKRLCGSAEWLASCQGPDETAYCFGNDWDPSICNSVDTYCQECCDILGIVGDDCPTYENCGYDSELSSSYTPETCFITADYGRDTCHVCFHVMPTGAFPRCTSQGGLFDVNGNVWEIVSVPTSEDSRGYQVRGGAFNCGAPSSRFECAFNATWSDLYAGFRCCKDPVFP